MCICVFVHLGAYVLCVCNKFQIKILFIHTLDLMISEILLFFNWNRAMYLKQECHVDITNSIVTTKFSTEIHADFAYEKSFEAPFSQNNSDVTVLIESLLFIEEWILRNHYQIKDLKSFIGSPKKKNSKNVLMTSIVILRTVTSCRSTFTYRSTSRK